MKTFLQFTVLASIIILIMTAFAGSIGYQYTYKQEIYFGIVGVIAVLFLLSLSVEDGQ